MNLLEEPAGHAVRLLALNCLDQAAAAAERLDVPDDTHALHDFRVSLRRLRSLIQIYRVHFHGSIPELFEARLQRLMQRTNPARDHEVHLAWLQAQRSALPRTQHAGLNWLIEEIAAMPDKAGKPTRLRKRFARIDSGLRDHLADRSEDALLHDEQDSRFAEAFRDVVRQASKAVAKRAAAVTDAENARALHKLRIAGKRLRYAMEPLREEVAAIEKPLQACRRMQDLLGAMQDASNLSTLLAHVIEQAAAERARMRLADALAGRKRAVADYHNALVTLARLARDERLTHFAAFKKEFLRGGLKRLLAQVEALGTALGEGVPA